MALRKIAFITAHESPLAHAGNADCGEQNVDMAHVACQLVQLGYAVDIFTRLDRTRSNYVQVADDGYRVVHVPAGPVCELPEERLLPHMDEFADFVSDFFIRESRFRKPYDLIHAKFFMSAMAGLALRKRFEIPLVVTLHALDKVRRLHQGPADAFPDARFAIEDRLVQEAGVLIAKCAREVDRPEHLDDADAGRMAAGPCGIDGFASYPVDSIAVRRAFGWDPEQLIVLQLGRCKGIGNVIRAIAQSHRKHGARAQLCAADGKSPAFDARRVATPGIVSGSD